MSARTSGRRMPRILFVATYSRFGPSTGGVVRLDALATALERQGHETHTLAVVPPRSRWNGSHSGETILPLAEASFSGADWNGIGLHEVLVGVRAAEDAALLDKARSLATDWRPDIYVLEQPFLLPVVEAMLAAHPGKLVYSAANIEAPLKRDLVSIAYQHFRHPDRDALIASAGEVERRAAAISDLTVCIAPSMVEVVESWGARRTVVCGNGSRLANTAAPESAIVEHLASAASLVFGCLGSAYWPNTEGLASVIAPSLAFLPLDVRLALAGDIGQHLRDHRLYRRGRLVNDSRIADFGFLAAEDYDALARCCDALVVPLFVGSGSPLKSADALATGGPIILSRKGSSGYEDVIAAAPAGVVIAETPSDFRVRWAEMAHRSKQSLAEDRAAGQARAALLTWDNRTRPFVEAIAALGPDTTPSITGNGGGEH